MSNNYELVKRAILTKQQILATYKGHYREMCPHTLGASKTGIRQALFYQFAGESSSGLSPAGSANNWRCIPVDELRNVILRDGDWHTAPNHSRAQTCVASIDVEVAS